MSDIFVQIIEDGALGTVNDISITVETESPVKFIEVGVPGPAGVDGAQGPQGIQGIQGIQGQAGSGGDLTFTHTQGVASDTWSVAHNLNKFPSVIIVNDSGMLIYADVEYVDINNVTITFAAPETGKAYFN